MTCRPESPSFWSAKAVVAPAEGGLSQLEADTGFKQKSLLSSSISTTVPGFCYPPLALYSTSAASSKP